MEHRKIDERIVWVPRDPSRAKLPQMPPTVWSTCSYSRGENLASETFFWRNGIPRSLLGVIDLKKEFESLRKGSCMTKS